MLKNHILTIGTGGHFVFRVEEGRAEQIAYAPRPTFLARAGDHLYGVGEIGHGQVFRISGDPIPGGVMLGSVSGGAVADGLAGEPISSGGPHPCHISAHPDGTWVYVSNYGDGTVRAIEVAGGEFGHTIDLLHEGSGPDAARQNGPHAHFSQVAGGRLVIADLGTDDLRIHELDGGVPQREAAMIPMLPGSGPRHFTTSGDLLVVAGELDGRLSLVDLSAGKVIRTVAAATAPGVHLLSHIVSAQGLIFVGVRGSNTISVLNEELEILQEVPTATWPRHFALAGEGLIVAGERSDEIVWHPLADGAEPLGPITDRIGVQAPMFVGVGREL